MNKSYVSNVVSRYSNKVIKDVSSILPKGPASSYKCFVFTLADIESMWNSLKSFTDVDDPMAVCIVFFVIFLT